MSDLIDRQQAIDAIEKNACNTQRIMDAINGLPSVQSEPTQIISETRAIPSDDDPYYSTMHERVAKCVSDLRDHFSLGYIVDPCGGIQALEITTKELMNY